MENEKYLEIQALTKYGHESLMNGSTAEANETFLQVLQLSKQIDDLFVSRACSFNLGACYVAAGQPKLGLKYLELAIPPEDVNDGLENVADLWYNIGVARHAIGDIPKAIVAYEKAQFGYQKLPAKRLEAECLSKLAICYHLTGRLKDSQEMYYKSHEVYESIGDRNNQALCLVSLTGIFSEQNDIEGCAKVLDILLDVCQDVEDKHLQAKIYHDIGLLYISEKLYESSSECFDQSLKCLEKDLAAQDKALEATVLQNLGAVFNYIGSYQKAVQYHQKAIDIFGELNDRNGQSQVFGNLAFAFTQLENYGSAAMTFQHAVQAAKDCGDKESQCLSTEGLAAIYFRLGDYKNSILYYKEALSLVSSSNLGNVHSERIVEKLSDAIQIQTDERARENSTVISTTPSTENTTKKHTRKKMNNMQRYFRNKQHSLIAKGLETDSCEENEESEYSADEIRTFQANLVEEDNTRKRSSDRYSEFNVNETLPTTPAEKKTLHTINDNGMNFSMKSTLRNEMYELPKLNESDVPRADREYYLANLRPQNTNVKDERKESSKMCSIM